MGIWNCTCSAFSRQQIQHVNMKQHFHIQHDFQHHAYFKEHTHTGDSCHMTCISVSVLTFQSSEVTSLLLGTSWPPSRMQCLRTSCVELLVLFSLRFQIRAVESPDLRQTHRNISDCLTGLAVSHRAHWFQCTVLRCLCEITQGL